MQMIVNIRSQEERIKRIRKDDTLKLSQAGSNSLFSYTNYSCQSLFCINQTPSTIYDYERAD